MTDFRVVDVPSMLSAQVTISDGSGASRPDPDWNREAAETQYVFAELLAAEGLLAKSVDVSRRPDLVIMWSDLTPIGQAFVKAHFHKWLQSVDRSGTTEETMRKKLAARWQKFSAEV